MMEFLYTSSSTSYSFRIIHLRLWWGLASRWPYIVFELGGTDTRKLLFSSGKFFPHHPTLVVLRKSDLWNRKWVGEIQRADHREYGSADITISEFYSGASGCFVWRVSTFAWLRKSNFFWYQCFGKVWMSHADNVSKLPPDFHVIGYTDLPPYAAVAHNSKPLRYTFSSRSYPHSRWEISHWKF